MDSTPHLQKRTLMIAGGFALAALIGLFAFSAYLNHSLSSETASLDSGLQDFSEGDLENARASFEQAATNADSIDARGRYEMLVAATYEGADMRRMAELYLAVVNNEEYSPIVRSYAASYLMLALSNNAYDPALVQMVFSSAPWAGAMENPRIKSERLRYNLALAKGHEWALSMRPNFLAYLLAGELYARLYESLPQTERGAIDAKRFFYFQEGSALFTTFAAHPASHQNVIATGHRAQALYANELYSARDNAGNQAVPSAAVIENYFVRAEEYMESLPPSGFKSIMQATTLVYHAEFLVAINTEEGGTGAARAQLERSADRLAEFVERDPVVAAYVRSIGAAESGRYAALRRTIVSLALSSPQLAAVLVAHAGFAAQEFVQ